ncbi:MAG: hypothetical protein AB7R69_00345 [Candidatus Babeliales bacterium]
MTSISSYFIITAQHLGFISWQDPVEIIILAGIIYYFSLWLHADKTKPLLTYFYSYCLIFFGCYHFNFLTISSFLLFFSPVIFTLIILIHQELLQRNFVALKKIIPAKASIHHDWLEHLVRMLVRTAHSKKTVLCIIEQEQALHHILEAPFILNTTFQPDILKLLIESSSYDHEKIIWLDNKGTVIAVNSWWKKAIDELWQEPEIQKAEKYLGQASIITAKSDALFLRCNAETATFDIVAQGKIVEHVAAAQALRVIKHYINYSPDSTKQGEKNHANPLAQKSFLDQHQH